MKVAVRHTKINKILNNYPKSIIMIGDITKFIIDDVEYIEKNTIYKLTSLNIIEIKNILEKTSSLRHCLLNSELRTLRIKNKARDYILYSLKDIIEINRFKQIRTTSNNVGSSYNYNID